MTGFHYACEIGRLLIARTIIEKSAELKIDLNAKDDYCSETAFLRACYHGKIDMIEMIIENAESYGIDITAQNSYRQNGFQIAKEYGKTDAANLIKEKFPSIDD